MAFTGDGANDMGALKQADMGLSLSKSETSISASYVSDTISGFIQIMIESRAGLERSYISFKFMAFYSLIQFIVTYQAYLNYQMWDNMHWVY